MNFKQWSKNKFIPCDAEYAEQVWDAATQAERERVLAILDYGDTLNVAALDREMVRTGAEWDEQKQRFVPSKGATDVSQAER